MSSTNHQLTFFTYIVSYLSDPFAWCYTVSHPFALYYPSHPSHLPDALHVVTLTDIIMICYSSGDGPELWLVVSSIQVCKLIM